MLVKLAIMLISFEINLGYNLKYYEPMLTKKEMLDIKVAQLEDRLNNQLMRWDSVRIGDVTYRLKGKGVSGVKLLKLKMLSYTVKTDRIEAFFEVIPVSPKVFVSQPCNKIVKMSLPL